MKRRQSGDHDKAQTKGRTTGFWTIEIGENGTHRENGKYTKRQNMHGGSTIPGRGERTAGMVWIMGARAEVRIGNCLAEVESRFVRWQRRCVDGGGGPTLGKI